MQALTNETTPAKDLGRDMALELLQLSWHDEALLTQATAPIAGSPST
jgi:hypothetical protein